MLFNRLKWVVSAFAVLFLTACSTDARYHEVQAARLGECSHMADKEYHQCIKRQEDGYKEFKQQQDIVPENDLRQEHTTKND
ncbi:hypothetical protein [Pseudoalteromonas sp. SR41-4]|uniref:hypothetical protein n=1 Tax=Pseudoalteromonas sp. SR41-4 TaxID=2760950 RepID=UPI0016044132|nr:hypothetical protein [Pseudoalteromonas sp. SR41-4]MBB1292130.1 hypothetical protein [Pseudoalteromonas sp. SR41-4]